MLNTKILRLTDAGFLLYSPVSVLAYPVSVLVVNPDRSPLILFAIGLIITLVSWLPYKTLEFVLNKTNAESLVWVLVSSSMTIVITGAVRGFVFYFADQYFSLIQPSPLPERIFSSLFTTLIWLSAANAIINISRNFRSLYQSALNQFLASQMTGASFLKNTDADELKKFQDGLSGSLSELLKQSNSESLKAVSEKLTFHINEELRPLSRRIWLRSLTEYPVINYKILLRDSLRRLNFSQRAFWSIMTSLALLENLFLRNLNESLWRTGSYLLATWLIIYFFKNKLTSKQRIKANLIFLIFVGLLPIYISEISSGLLGFKTHYLAATLITPIPIAVLVVLSLLELTQQDRNFLLKLLEETGKENYIERGKGIDLNRRQLASYLHNSFQSELIALSGQLAAAAISEDRSEAKAVLQKVSAATSRSLADDLAKINQEPLARLNSIIESWKNLLTIELQISNEILVGKLNNTVFTQTVEEIASNAHRHDGATHLTITASQGDLGTSISFQTNGINPITPSKGLGSVWLNQISLSPWTIEKNYVGTLIKIEI